MSRKATAMPHMKSATTSVKVRQGYFSGRRSLPRRKIFPPTDVMERFDDADVKEGFNGTNVAVGLCDVGVAVGFCGANVAESFYDAGVV
ncbi:hypothetical protein Csa_015453 [Cucumis sativus]|uniref:Uncharacterized protein n=1 Tax=Cucumis sativus TaxID=3659 RepID=A0A0A0K568_CUCSA|nr:hypothetical protein Csa_015453 [Cucumis sativus]